MLIAAETVTVLSDGLMLDQIIWRKFRRPTPGLVEATLKANPGLADLGPNLPSGTVFTIPATEINRTLTDPAQVLLWG